jgi:hypothetical protein
MATLLISRAPSLLALLRLNRHPHARRTQHYLPRADIDVHGGIEHVVRKLSKSPIKPIGRSQPRLTPLLTLKTSSWHNNDSTGRDTYHQSNEGIPDGPLAASFLRCATGPTAQRSWRQHPTRLFPRRTRLIRRHSSCRHSHVDLNRTLITSDLSRRLMRVLVNQCECGGDHWQCLEGYEHEAFDSSRSVS